VVLMLVVLIASVLLLNVETSRTSLEDISAPVQLPTVASTTVHDEPRNVQASV
jgi:hypothetical protein